ncbi:hypothetical protein PAMP_018958 [Pampus punctatissimus]
MKLLCVRAVYHLRRTEVLSFHCCLYDSGNVFLFTLRGMLKYLPFSSHHLLILYYSKQQSWLSVNHLLYECCCSVQLHNTVTW